jgi:hypothetical protein
MCERLLTVVSLQQVEREKGGVARFKMQGSSNKMQVVSGKDARGKMQVARCKFFHASPFDKLTVLSRVEGRDTLHALQSVTN